MRGRHGLLRDPDRTLTALGRRTPDDFVFDVKALALMTVYATDFARLPLVIRDELPPDLGPRVYAKDLPVGIQDEVWRLFHDAMAPLHESGRLGAVLLQFAPWVLPNKGTPTMLARVRERLGDLPVSTEFRNPSWLAPRLRERLWAQLREQDMTYVVADTPPGTKTSLPIVPAVTTPDLAIVRLRPPGDPQEPARQRCWKVPLPLRCR
jgi:uncharacterized protein YecE (DUF72 family)